MDRLPRISCLVHQGVKIIPESFLSFFAQTYPEREMVVLTWDRSEAERLREVPNCQAVHVRRPMKPFESMKLACEVATGHWACVWDGSSVSHPERLRHQWQIADKPGRAGAAFADTLHLDTITGGVYYVRECRGLPDDTLMFERRRIFDVPDGTFADYRPGDYVERVSVHGGVMMVTEGCYHIRMRPVPPPSYDRIDSDEMLGLGAKIARSLVESGVRSKIHSFPSPVVQSGAGRPC